MILCAEGLENCTGRIREVGAEVVILVDAVDAGLEPGALVLASLDSEQSPPPLSTHGLPKRLILSAVGVREAWVLGIQVKSLGVGASLSPEVSKACEMLAGLLAELLCGMR
uniref:Hydrogenase maturation protease n=1 Tax=Thermofilum pendens TaxID=2269 RepID=A0A7C3SL71_THEPE